MALGAGGTLKNFMRSAERARAQPENPAVRVVDDGRTNKKLRVTGAQPGRPFWLVLGESNSAGWKATVAGEDAGGSTLVDGYANGWLVVPTASDFDVTLEWVPQRPVWIALAISGVTLLLCLVLALWRRRPSGEDRAASAEIDGALQLANPLVAVGAAPGRRALIVATLSAGLVAAVLARWWVGVIVALCVVVVLLRPRLRPLLTLGAPACVAVTALYVLVQQHRYRYPYDFFWVEHFSAVTNLAWLGVLLLAADALVELVRSRRPEARGPTGSS
jgi:hypothetical protein